MTAIEKLVSVARGELGYREKRSNSSLDDKTANAGSGNWTKYARDLDAMTDFYNGAKNGYAWCDVFVDWCFYKAFGAETAKKLLCQPSKSAGAGCTYSLAYYLQKGQFTRTGPQPGDQIFFGSVGSSSHTGLVVSVGSGKVNTIEGNTSDGVYERSYSLGASNIAGYGRPNWSLVGEVTNDIPTYTPIPSVPSAPSSDGIMRKGDIGEDVRKLQQNLIKLDYDVGFCGADGEFGEDTLVAVMAFQRANGLEVDGEVGPLTLEAIEKALKLVTATPSTPTEAAKPSSNTTTDFAVGDTVMFIGDKHYTNAFDDDSYPCKPGKAKITLISKVATAKHPYHLVKLVGGGSTVFGWVDEKDMQKV